MWRGRKQPVDLNLSTELEGDQLNQILPAWSPPVRFLKMTAWLLFNLRVDLGPFEASKYMISKVSRNFCHSELVWNWNYKKTLKFLKMVEKSDKRFQHWEMFGRKNKSIRSFLCSAYKRGRKNKKIKGKNKRWERHERRRRLALTRYGERRSQPASPRERAREVQRHALAPIVVNNLASETSFRNLAIRYISSRKSPFIFQPFCLYSFFFFFPINLFHIIIISLQYVQTISSCFFQYASLKKIDVAFLSFHSIKYSATHLFLSIFHILLANAPPILRPDRVIPVEQGTSSEVSHVGENS